MNIRISVFIISILLTALIPISVVMADAATIVKENLFLSGTKSSTQYGLEEPTTVPSEIRNRKLVCIFFDDGTQNNYDIPLPILLEHGFKATFAMVTDKIDTYASLNRSELIEMANQGMDIASHSCSHRDMAALDDSELSLEITDSKMKLEQLGIKVRTFAYPFNSWSGDSILFVKKAGYTCARAGGSNPYIPFHPKYSSDPDSIFHVESITITDQDINKFKTMVDKANEHDIVCILYHAVADSWPEKDYSTPISNFQEQMDYLKNNGFDVVLLPDLIEEPSAFTGDPNGITNKSAILHMTYDFKSYDSGYVQFAYTDNEGPTVYTPWVSKTGSGTHDETVTNLIPNKTYVTKARLKYGTIEKEGDEDPFRSSIFSPEEQQIILIVSVSICIVALLLALNYFRKTSKRS